MEKIHFIGIGGIGISALAQYYLKKGYKISGSDLVCSEITKNLEKLGVRVFIGKHNKRFLAPNIKRVIYSPAIPWDNPELKEARKLKIECLSYPEALGELTKKYFTIAIAGTHGKSTTTAMIALILMKGRCDPTVIIGTKLREFKGNNFRMGKSKFLVIEADEHFASFLNYWPNIIVLTSIEVDHLDYYKNFKNYLNSFRKFISRLPEDGIFIANKEDKNVAKLLNARSRNLERIRKFYLKAKEKKGYLHFFAITKNGRYSFLKKEEGEIRKIRKILKIPGVHNVYNSLSALTVGRILKIPDSVIFKALSEYKGCWRRFEIIKSTPFVLISDYAHHPTEVLATLRGAREIYPQRKIWCIYQPHQYQRTFYLFKDFVRVFRKVPVEQLIITDIYEVPGREEKEVKKKVSGERLVKEIKKENVIYLPQKRIVKYLKENVKRGEVVIIMGAGDIYKLVYQL